MYKSTMTLTFSFLDQKIPFRVSLDKNFFFTKKFFFKMNVDTLANSNKRYSMAMLTFSVLD